MVPWPVCCNSHSFVRMWDCVYAIGRRQSASRESLGVPSLALLTKHPRGMAHMRLLKCTLRVSIGDACVAGA